jgi:DNA repair protein RadD
MAELNLYDHQKQLVEQIHRAWLKDRRVMCWLPTGGGKTELSVAIAKEEAERGGCTLFVVERKTLAAQAGARFRKYGMLVGMLRGDATLVRGYEPVVVASIQTIRHRADSDEVQATLARVTRVIIDEAHIRHQDHNDLDEALPDALILGLSATPLRTGLGLHFDTLVRGPSYAWMIENGYLIKPRYFLPHLDALKAGIGDVNVSSTGDFVSNDLSRLMRDRTIIGDVVGTWQGKGEDRPTIAFCVDIAHSKDLCDEFRLAGVAAEHIDQRTPEDERAAMFQRFREGTTRVLCSVIVLGTGFDEPSASCTILARPTLSTILHVQQIGRVMRTHPGKNDCIVLDHAGNVVRHGRVEEFEPPELCEIDKTSDKKKRDTQAADFFPCPECAALMSPGQRVCQECGHEIRRINVVDFLPGELTEDPDAASDNLSREELRELYLQLRHIAWNRGWKDGWAYFKLKDHYGFKPPFAWKDQEPIPPTDKTLRLVRSWDIRFAKGRAKKRA